MIDALFLFGATCVTLLCGLVIEHCCITGECVFNMALYCTERRGIFSLAALQT